MKEYNMRIKEEQSTHICDYFKVRDTCSNDHHSKFCPFSGKGNCNFRRVGGEKTYLPSRISRRDTNSVEPQEPTLLIYE